MMKFEQIWAMLWVKAFDRWELAQLSERFLIDQFNHLRDSLRTNKSSLLFSNDES